MIVLPARRVNNFDHGFHAEVRDILMLKVLVSAACNISQESMPPALRCAGSYLISS